MLNDMPVIPMNTGKPSDHFLISPSVSKPTHSLARNPHWTQENQLPRTTTTKLGESRGALGAEDLLAGDLGDTVGERESQVLGQELLDVRALDVVGLLELDNTEDLSRAVSISCYFPMMPFPLVGLGRGENVRGST